MPPKLRLLARRVYYLPNEIFGKRSELEPPKGKIFIGSGDFIAQGKHQVDLLKRHAGIASNHALLDIGCGIGRTAVALVDYLDNGSYEGFDVMSENINWCQKNISSKYPHFQFQYTPLNNDLYNSVKSKASDFTFPYADERFNRSFLFSVFTHMQKDEVQHYLKEIARTLKDNGKCLSTFFIYSDDNESIIANPKRAFSFPFQIEDYRLMDAKTKAANTAFHIKSLQEMAENAGLKVEKMIPGFWTDNSLKNEANSFQDIIVFQKG
ncbi:MAG: class I SAM-dependent methyltransferase [Bacteroidota bacterium]